MNIFAGTGQTVERYEELLVNAKKSAERQTNQGRAPPKNKGVKYSIEPLPDGNKYVRADRQVIFGNDPEAWSEQLENYINGKIRRGQNVQLTAEDGDILVLTEDTAGKVSSRYTSDGRTLEDSYYETKVNAGAHIDELATVSKRGKKIVSDRDNRHGAKAEKGWNYRIAYFRDFDNQYYRCKISVSIGKDGNAIYNIGEMEKKKLSHGAQCA